jgi:hypothetical protein
MTDVVHHGPSGCIENSTTVGRDQLAPLPRHDRGGIESHGESEPIGV